MTTLRWLRDRFLPELIHLNPVVALAFYESVAMNSADEAAAGPSRPLVFRARGGVAGLDLAEVARHAPVQAATRVRR